MIYEDDGRSFDYRNGDWMGLSVAYRDAGRRLSVSLAPGSRMLPPTKRVLLLRTPGAGTGVSVEFDGRPIETRLP